MSVYKGIVHICMMQHAPSIFERPSRLQGDKNMAGKIVVSTLPANDYNRHLNTHYIDFHPLMLLGSLCWPFFVIRLASMWSSA